MRKSYFILIDTETTKDDLVADFGAAIIDRRGAVFGHCAVLVRGIYTDRERHPLFYSDSNDSIFAAANLDQRYANYERMIESGSRMVATPTAINNWLGKAASRYGPPILTAYNLSFDLGKCANTGIDLTMFPKRFCLMQAAQTAFAKSKAYKRMILRRHCFRSPTRRGNMTYRTDAETMAWFCSGENDLGPEPHTAIEDIMFYELPILNRLTRTKSNHWLLTEPRPHSWREFQMRDNFRPK